MIGQRINNHEIVQPLGEGGMGAVYLAKHPFLERKAAIKILKPECASNAAYVQRFLNEARAANAIHHPNIIDIIDVGILPNGVPYMMMEFLDGESLAQKLRRVRRLPVDEAVFVVRQIASALDAAHAAGIVHRDLKPDNVFVVPDRQSGREHIKVLDFGIAKLRPEFAPDTPRTSAGALMGTPAYMSPEQCMGKTDEIDHRADIYALGVILYQCLCGRTPFEGESFGDYFLQHITTPPPPPTTFNPEIPPPIEALILKAMAKQAADRVQSMRDFDELLAGRTVPTTVAIEHDGAPVRPVQPTVSLEDEEPDRRTGERSASPTGRSHSWADPSMPSTTLSSSIGQLHDGRRVHAEGRRTNRLVLMAAIAVALIAAAGALLVLRPGQETTDESARATPSQPSPKALPPFALPAAEPKAAAPAPAPAPPSTTAAEPASRPVAEAPARTGKGSGQGRQHGREHPGDRDGSKHARGQGATAGPGTLPPTHDDVPPTLAPAPTPTPANQLPAPKTIVREKF